MSGDLPIRGCYLSRLDLDHILTGADEEAVFTQRVSDLSRSISVRVVSVTWGELAAGVSNALADPALVKDIIAAAYEVSDIIDSGVDKAPGPAKETKAVLRYFSNLTEEQRYWFTRRIVHLVASIVIRDYFEE